MKSIPGLAAVLILTAGVANAESKIDKLCGPGHVSEAASAEDVSANPDGYYIRSMQVQLRNGDPRIVRARGNAYHMCTRPAATPDMDASRAILMEGERVVKYLFVPIAPGPQRGS